MLILAYKLGEKIKIGDEITLTIVEIDRGRIRLGIDAPQQILVLRSELVPGFVDPPEIAKKNKKK